MSKLIDNSKIINKLTQMFNQKLIINYLIDNKKKFYPLFLFILCFSIFIKTTAPTVTAVDSGQFLASVYFLGINHPPGYPLYLICAKLFSYIAFLFYPFFYLLGINPLKISDTFAFNVNLMSGFLVTWSGIVFYYISDFLIKLIYRKNISFLDTILRL